MQANSLLLLHQAWAQRQNAPTFFPCCSGHPVGQQAFRVHACGHNTLRLCNQPHLLQQGCWTRHRALCLYCGEEAANGFHPSDHRTKHHHFLRFALLHIELQRGQQLCCCTLVYLTPWGDLFACDSPSCLWDMVVCCVVVCRSVGWLVGRIDCPSYGTYQRVYYKGKPKLQPCACRLSQTTACTWLFLFLSSHCSFPWTMPSPQTCERGLIVQLLRQASLPPSCHNRRC